MICAACGTDNANTRKFCRECGQALSISCSNCGAANVPEDKFCGECGTPLAGQAQAAATPTATSPSAGPAAERRLVSVLFADLVGFTSLSERRDAEEVRELLTRYFDTCRRLIERYGGIVEKFIGDAVMAVWGTPVATEDDAERAVRAALELTAAASALGEELGEPTIRARAGVLTGEAAVTIGAEGQGMVAGDLVNTASRIQAEAPPGAVCVGESTKRATDATIVYEDAGSHELKGKASLVPLWRAVRVIAGARGTLKPHGLEAPFVGRDRELRLVKELFHASAEEKKAHLVSVVGIAGIGKSRITWEFYKYFDGLVDVTWWHRGRCPSYGDGVTYWALAEMVKMRARIAEDEEPISAMAKLRETLEEHVQDPEERMWIEPRLSQLLGLEDHAARDREDLFAGWRRFFERLAEQHPCVLVFEDMQWADGSLLDFIEYLLEWSRSFPIFVVTLARPELMDHRPNWGAGWRNFTSLYLEPLPSEAMHQLMSGLVPGLPPDMVERILERAGGVPLYAVETVRMLLDRGLLAQEGAAYRPSGLVESLEVPETLHALIAARLDGLSQDERRIVQDGSVLGKTFFKQGLAMVSSMSEEELEPILASLVRKEVLSSQADPRSPERGQYGFLQDLVKRVAYEMLSKKERKAKHLAAVAFIEQGWAGEEDEIVEVLAAHLVQAYEVVPDAADAPEIRSKARELLVRAGQRAASLAASRGAQRYFERAIELTEDSMQLATLHESAGRAAWEAGRSDEARDHFEAAIALLETEGEMHAAARVSSRLGEVDHATGRLDKGIDRMERAFHVLVNGGEADDDLARLAASLARLHYFAGNRDIAAERVDVALEIAEKRRLAEVLSQALNTKGIIALSRIRVEEALAFLNHALKMALDHDIPSAALRAYNNIGYAMGILDRHEDEIRVVQPAIELARRVGDRPWEWALSAGTMAPLFYTGRWDEALAVAAEIVEAPDFDPKIVPVEFFAIIPLYIHRDELHEAEKTLSMTGATDTSEDVQTRAVYDLTQAMLKRAAGDVAGALTAAERAFEAGAHIGVVHPLVKDGLTEALEAAFMLRSWPKAEELLTRIDSLSPAELTPFYAAQRARYGGRLSAARGEDQAVERRFKAAAGLFREIVMPFWLAVTLLEHAEWLIRQQRTDDAQPLFEEARAIFERLKAKPWLERLRGVGDLGAASLVEAEP